jgi:drug/metabolite transporter (DMT)-like permease
MKNMWLLFTWITFACWGIADLFYKKGNNGAGEYNHIKTGILVGVVMGIHGTIYLMTNHVEIRLLDMVKYLPVSLLYISSMVVGYRGLKYIELSISSPIQNTSGVITGILLAVVFHEALGTAAWAAIVLIFIGIFGLSLSELRESREERRAFHRENTRSRIFFLTILFPLFYCLLDGVGTFLDGIYLDQLELISEDVALVAYEYTFFLYALVSYFYLRHKKEKLDLPRQKDKILAAVFETAGQFFYVYAMSGNSIIAAPIIGSYCVLSLILGHIFLKEKLSKEGYLEIGLVIAGIVILSFLDI